MTQRRLNLFPTPLIIDEIDGADALNAELENIILKRMNADPGIKRSNLGGWHSETDLWKWAGDPGSRIKAHALGLADANTTAARGAELSWAIAGWANVNAPGTGNAPHVHGGNYWSAVYYVKVGEGEGGRLRLHDPRLPALRMHSPVLRFTNAGPEVVYRFRPRAGQMLMFPAWLSHSVEAWEGRDQRISIAMNIRRTRGASRRGAAANPS